MQEESRKKTSGCSNWLLKLIVDKLFKTFLCYFCFCCLRPWLMKASVKTTFSFLFCSELFIHSFYYLTMRFSLLFLLNLLIQANEREQYKFEKRSNVDVKPKDTLSTVWKIQINFHLFTFADEQIRKGRCYYAELWSKKIYMLDFILALKLWSSITRIFNINISC